MLPLRYFALQNFEDTPSALVADIQNKTKEISFLTSREF